MGKGTELTSFIEEEFSQLEAKINGAANSDLHQLRKDSLKAFSSLPFPTTKDEEWKYTNIKSLSTQEFEHSAGKLTSESANKEVFEGAEGIKIFLNNGSLSKELSDLDDLPDGLIISTIEEAVESTSPGISYYGKLANISDKFTSLNSSLVDGGVYIHVDKNKVIESPIYIFNINTNTSSSLSQPRVLIIVEENAQLKVCEKSPEYNSTTVLENIVTEVLVEKAARLEHYQITPDSDSLSRISTTSVIQKSNSAYHHSSFTFGGDTVRNNLKIRLEGEYSETYMNGLYLIDGNSHVDNHTSIDHTQPNSYSDELYKGILDENATGVFNGKVFVRQAAQKTNAFQSNKNILLSDNSTVNTKPQLEIWADDVKCSHGATTGQLDEEALFYLQARGLSPKSAKRLLLEAFANEVMERVSLEPVKAYLANMIITKLNS